MNRREFGQRLAAAAMVQAVLRGEAQTVAAESGESSGVRFSVMLWTLEKQAPFEQCLEIVAAAGYQGVELVGEFYKWTPDTTRRMMAKMRSLGLVFDAMSGVKAGFADPSQNSAPPGAQTGDFMTQLAAQIEWAKRLECRKIILLSGKRVEGVDQKQVSIKNLKRAAEVASRNGMDIVIEPIDPLENPSIYLTTVSEGFEIVRAVGSRQVKVLYDFYHEQRAFGNLIEKLEQNIDWVGLVHIADVPGRHEPGTGEIDYANIYRKLAELKYRGFIAMEFYPTGDPETTLRTARVQAERALRIGAVS